MSSSPDFNSEGLSTFAIFSDGEQINDDFGVVSIWVRKELNKISKAQIIIRAGNMPDQDIPESDDETFAPGKTIRIEAGYNSDNEIIFEGFITSHNLDILENEPTVLRIDCRDYAFSATLNKKSRVFENTKDSDAMSTILSEYSDISASVTATTTQNPELVQYYSTDWDFILSRAEANGFVVVSDGKKISIKKPGVSTSPSLHVKYGDDLISFRGELQTADQTDDLEAIAWDQATQKLLRATGSQPTLNEQGTLTPSKLAEAAGNTKWALQTNTTVDEATLKTWADAQLLRTGLSRIRGEVKFQGSSLALVDGTITLDGLGKRFNGDTYLGSVEHEIKDGNWYTTAGMGMDAARLTDSSDVSAPQAAGLLPGIQGLHIGKVMKIDEDPAKENKIQVEIPLLNGDKNNVWARLAGFWASNQYGAFFIPDVGDEVVLGFFNDNPCHPVILGSMYSSKQAPANKIDAENTFRSIVTKSKMKLEFNEVKKIITLETPGKNIIEISDEAKSITLTDQNQNKIEMSDSGILIDSAKSITLKAKTNIEITAGTNIDIKGGTAISMKAGNIEATADMAFTAKGNAQAELSAAGQVTVKGAIVMIN